MTTLSSTNYFIFKEVHLGRTVFFGFQMELDENKSSYFPVTIKHKNLEVIKIVLQLESHPINPDNSICWDLRFSMTDFQR